MRRRRPAPVDAIGAIPAIAALALAAASIAVLALQARGRRRSRAWMRRGIAVALFMIGALASTSPAGAHRLSAWFGGGTCQDPIPCDATHIAGGYQVGVPGVDLNYTNYFTSVDSDTGHSAIDAGWSWSEGTTPPGSYSVADVIEENVDLIRIAPGPIIVRATLLLDAAAQVFGNGGVRMAVLVSFNGCQVYATQDFFSTSTSDLDVIGDCGAEATGSALVVTQTYDGQPPSHPLLRTQLESDYLALPSKNTTIAVQLASDLRFEVWNATTRWDTSTFLTQAPEPDANALAATCVAILALRAGFTAKAAARGTPRRGRAPTRPA